MEEDSDPEYITNELPEDSELLLQILQKEIARPRPSPNLVFVLSLDIPFLRSILKKNHFSIPSDLRCRLYSFLLSINSSVITNLAESTWPTDSINIGIIEDYIHNIYPRFSSSRINPLVFCNHS